MSYDPLKQRVTAARDILASSIQHAKLDIRDAKTRLAVLEEMEIRLNLDAIVDAVPDENDI
jgi:hypothetical protein